MSTLAIPAKVPSPRDDARSLHDAFKGITFFRFKWPHVIKISLDM